MSFAKNVHGKATNPINSAIATTVVVSTPAAPNTTILTIPMPSDTAASVAITAAPSRPAAMRNRQHDHAGAGGATDDDPPARGGRDIGFFPELVAAASKHPPQRYGRDQGRADDQRRTTPGQERIEPRPEHAGRQRR